MQITKVPVNMLIYLWLTAGLLLRIRQCYCASNIINKIMMADEYIIALIGVLLDRGKEDKLELKLEESMKYC